MLGIIVSVGQAIRATNAESDAVASAAAERTAKQDANDKRQEAEDQRDRARRAEVLAKQNETKAEAQEAAAKRSAEDALAVLEFFETYVLAAARPIRMMLSIVEFGTT